MQNVAYSSNAILTSDGCVSAVGDPAEDTCCPANICNLDACSIMCAFVELLPNGPLWDRAKVEAMSRYGASPCAPTCSTDLGSCATLADYAIYSGYQLITMLQGPLWSAIRESSPYTAVETLDSWLSLYGWQNSWETLCRDPRLGPSPFECGAQTNSQGNCDDNFAPIYIPPIPANIDRAVKRGIAIALSRLQMRPIKNLCGINWVLEPLNAELLPDPNVDSDACCKGQRYIICSKSPTLDPVPEISCFDQAPAPVPASFTMPELVYDDATGTCTPTGPGTITVWPAVMAAQIIALSFLQTNGCATVPIRRC